MKVKCWFCWQIESLLPMAVELEQSLICFEVVLSIKWISFCVLNAPARCPKDYVRLMQCSMEFVDARAIMF